MPMKRFTPQEIKLLRKNKYVNDVTDTRIMYSDEFRNHFIREYRGGKKPTQIFREAGFDTRLLGSKRIERAAARWRKMYEDGSDGLAGNNTLWQIERTAGAIENAENSNEKLLREEIARMQLKLDYIMQQLCREEKDISVIRA